MSFEKKKIQAETLGEYLQQARQDLNLSLEDINSRIGIRIQFLKALEQGEFKALPAEVYVLGFLRQLSEIYHTDPKSLIDQFRRERQIYFQLQQKALVQKNQSKGFFSRIKITPKTLSFFALGLFLIFTFLYVVWQVSSINKAPNLSVDQPRDRQVVFGSAVEVRGKTDPGANLSVNGQTVFVDSVGNFQIQLSLEQGPKDLSVVAKNKFDKATVINLSVIGQPQVSSDARQAELKLQFSGDGNLDYSIDDGPADHLDFHSGDAKTLFGKSKILISTSNAGATSAVFNGQSLGPLGRSGEQLMNIPFFAKASSTN